MYVELHCHSCFSLLDGAGLPEALVARAKALGYPAIALTDHDELGGAVRFAQAASELELRGIIGAEVTVEAWRSGTDRRHGHRGKGATTNAMQVEPTTHLVLLAESKEGYGNLSTLITRARMDHPRGEPCISLDVLAQHARGLFALTGCSRGRVPSIVATGDLGGACEAAAVLLDIFDRRVAIECWDHGLAEEREMVRGLISIARTLDVPWVVTNDVHYVRARDRIVHDVLSCLKHERTLDTMGTRLRPNGEWYLKSAAQMRRRWQHAPEGIAATLAIAERCAFRMEQLAPTLPAFPLPPGVTADEYLEQLVEQGAWERWANAGRAEERDGEKDATARTAQPQEQRNRKNSATARTAQTGSEWASAHERPDSERPASPYPTEAHARQVEHELAMIRHLGLAGYFLIVWDIVRFARREGVLCQGRGSAANSAVCYCLGITAVDPIKLGLLFERFLSEERREAPDIDIDFAHRDREKVIQYVYGKYGRDHAAMVCEQITYRGRSAVRDAARVLGFSVEQGDALARLSDRFSARATAEQLLGARSESDGEEREDRAEETHTEVIARVFGQQMVSGTEAKTKADEVKWEVRHEPGSKLAPRGRQQLTSADRPRPNAAYEPYGSPSARDSGARAPRTNPRAQEVSARAHYMDPHARETHNERRNPTTAIRAADDESVSSPLVQAGLDPDDRRVRAIAPIVAGLHQVPRHRSIHVGGFVLTEEPLSRVVPIEPASMPDRTVIQWEKDDLDPVGLVKIDLLGLGMLTLIQDCLLYIRAMRGCTIDLGQLDMTDQAVFDDLCRADTIGVFQVESRAQMNTLPRLKPRSFYDLVVEVAIIRPGPIQGDMVHPYLRRRAGEEPVTYPHPSLEPILTRTLGVPLFQEQGMQVAIACAGFSAGEADMLRRAMGHKRSRERMAAICQKLIDGMTANGISRDIAMRIYNQINAFADYGFPESHAASFALLVYASAYLKHYYAPEFTAAILNAQPMGFYAPGTLVEDARRHGVVVMPVDITRSTWDASLEPRDGLATSDRGGKVAVGASARRVSAPSRAPAVRLGLRSIRGLGSKAKEIFERARNDGEGPFTSIEHFVRRTGYDRRVLRLLAEAGAFDAFMPDELDLGKRRAALWRVLETARGAAGPLAPYPVTAVPGPAPLPPMSPGELTEADYRMTGISLNGHPMKHLRPLLEPNGVRSAKTLVEQGRDGDRIAVAGLVICRQRPGTAKGFVFLTLEDETGTINVVVTPKRFERQALLISTTPLLLVRGVLQVEQKVVNVRAEGFRELKAEVGAEYAHRHDFH